MSQSASAAVRALGIRLETYGVPSARVDAELLVAHALGIDRSEIFRHPAPEHAVLEPLVERRIRREPLQHILGTAQFRHVTLQVGPGVFVPRPETELLVDLVAPMLPGRVVDLCSGSGALAAALADEFPGSEVHAVEASAVAFAWLERNVRTGAVLGDVRSALPELEGTVDVVVANPPYLVPGTPVEPEVLADPAEALWGGGPAALDEVRMCIDAARRLLRPGGLVALEHDPSQAEAVTKLMVGFTDVRGHRDLTGRPRFTTGRRDRLRP